MRPGSLVTDPISAISLGLALMFGTAGLPHILMRFFTVADAKAARKSVFYATGFIGYFYILTFIIGFGAITFVMTDPCSTRPVGADGAVDLRQGQGPDRRHQHGGDPPQRGRRRQPVPGLHLGRGLRHHPGGGGGPHPGRRLGGQPRPLRLGVRQGPRHRRAGDQGLQDRDRRARASSRSISATCSSSRTSPSWSASPSRSPPAATSRCS